MLVNLLIFQFMKVDGAVELPDTLEKAKFTSMSWTHDNKGLFYNVREMFERELSCHNKLFECTYS